MCLQFNYSWTMVRITWFQQQTDFGEGSVFLKYSVCKFFRTQASTGGCERAMHSPAWSEILRNYCREELGKQLLAAHYNYVAFIPPSLFLFWLLFPHRILPTPFWEKERQNVAFILPLQLPSIFQGLKSLISVFLLTLDLFWWPHIIQSPDLSIPFPLTITPSIKMP